MSGSQEKFDACVERIQREEGVPPFCQHANELVCETLDLDGGSSRSLARIVLKDLGLTSQLLRSANSAFYNHSGRAILSVPHGIALLGWDALRDLVSAVRYIEHYADRSPGLRELMLLSLMTAVHGREVATALDYPRPEEGHICGLFRNLGEVLVGCHCPREYAQIVLAMHQENIPERAACLRVLDYSWDDIASEVAADWNMPPKVNLCLRGWSGPLASPLDRSMVSIANYARDLTHAVYRRGARVDSLELPPLLDANGRRTALPLSVLRRIVESTLEESRATLSSVGIPAEGLSLEHQAGRAGALLAGAPVFDAAGLSRLRDAVEGASRSVRQGDFELTALIGRLLDTLRAAGFERAVFALLNEEHTAIRGRLASGEGAEDVLRRFQFSVDRAEGPLRAALQRKTDILVDRSRDGRYDRSTLVQAFDPSAFALFPILAGQRAIGCLYADRQGPSAGLDAGRTALGRVRDVMADAIRKKSPDAAK